MNRSAWRTQHIPDQSGRVALITGSNIGLGFEAARALAARGATVILACRSVEKAEAARQRIRAEHPGADLRIERLDISELDSVRACAERVRSQYSQLDLLINNAGVMAIPRQLTRDGFEMQFATNHLGHFALTGLLMPMLLARAGSRIVPVASLAARGGRIVFDDLMGERAYTIWNAYNQSKLANLMFGLELQRRLPRRGARTVSIIGHPGASSTNLFSTPGARIIKRYLVPLGTWVMQPPDRGVLPILYAATAPDAEPGAYYGPDGFQELKGNVSTAKIPAAARDQPAAARLWKISESLTGVRYWPD